MAAPKRPQWPFAKHLDGIKDDDVDDSEVEDEWDEDEVDFEAMLKTIIHTVKDDPALLAAVLKDKALYNWWQREQKKEEESKIRKAAYEKLTTEERRLLGIRIRKF